MLLFSNATISTRRPGTYDASTKVTAAATVVLTGVPVYIQEIGAALEAKGYGAIYAAKMMLDAPYDLIDGDEITGYDPLALGASGKGVPKVVAERVAVNNGLFEAHKTCYLRVIRQ